MVTRRLDVLTITIKEVVFEGRRLSVVRYIVNGKDLKSMVRKYESTGCLFEGLEPSAVLLPSRHMLGKPAPIFRQNGKTQLLVCEGCREPGCNPLFARIGVKKDVVTWSDFEGFRSDEQFRDLGPFSFDRKAYEQALQFREAKAKKS